MIVKIEVLEKLKCCACGQNNEFKAHYVAFEDEIIFSCPECDYDNSYEELKGA